MEERLEGLGDEIAGAVQELKMERAAGEFYEEALRNVLEYVGTRMEEADVEGMVKLVECVKSRAQRKRDLESLKSTSINEEIKSRPQTSLLGYRSTTSPGFNTRSLSSPLSPYFAEALHRSARCSKLSPFMSQGGAPRDKRVSQFTLANTIEEIKQEKNSDEDEEEEGPDIEQEVVETEEDAQGSRCLYVSEIPGVGEPDAPSGHSRVPSGSGLSQLRKKKHVRNSTMMALLPLHNGGELSPSGEDELGRSQSQN